MIGGSSESGRISDEWRKIRCRKEHRLDGRGERPVCLAGCLSSHPRWVGAECRPRLACRGPVIEGQEVDEGVSRLSVRVQWQPETHHLETVFGEQAEGVVAEPSLKGVELARRRVVGTKLKKARGIYDLYRLHFEIAQLNIVDAQRAWCDVITTPLESPYL